MHVHQILLIVIVSAHLEVHFSDQYLLQIGNFLPNFTEELAVIWSEFLHHAFLHHSFLNSFCLFFSHLSMLWLAFLHIFPLQEKSVCVCVCAHVCVFACAHAHASLFECGGQRSTLIVFLSYYLSFVLESGLSLSTKLARLTGQWALGLGLSVSLMLNYKYNTKIFLNVSPWDSLKAFLQFSHSSAPKQGR